MPIYVCNQWVWICKKKPLFCHSTKKTEKLKSFKNNAIYVKEPNYGETEEFQKRKVPSLYSSLLVISTGEAGGNKYKSYSRKPEKERERGANKQKRMSTNNLSNKAHKSD